MQKTAYIFSKKV